MSVGVLIITHGHVGQALIAAAQHVMPQLPLSVTAMEVPSNADPERMRKLATHHIRHLDAGDGVLILSDLFGATPSNIALQAGTLGARTRCVSGLNLPMLLRVMNYADKSLDELTDIAADGGRRGILIDHA